MSVILVCNFKLHDTMTYGNVGSNHRLVKYTIYRFCWCTKLKVQNSSTFFEWKLRVQNISYNIIKQNLKVRDFQNEKGIMSLVVLSLLS